MNFRQLWRIAKTSIIQVLLCLSILVCANALVAGPGETAGAQKPDSTLSPAVDAQHQTDLLTVFWKSIGLIVAFSALLYLGLRIVKNAAFGKNYGSRSPDIALLGSMAIGQKQTISIVCVLDHYLVLGTTESQISVLLDIPENQMNPEIKARLTSKERVANQSFREVLRKITNK